MVGVNDQAADIACIWKNCTDVIKYTSRVVSNHAAAINLLDPHIDTIYFITVTKVTYRTISYGAHGDSIVNKWKQQGTKQKSNLIISNVR